MTASVEHAARRAGDRSRPLAIVVAHHRDVRVVRHQLKVARWEVLTTGDLVLGLYDVYRFEPDVVVIDLAMARAGHRAGMPAVAALAPAATFLTLGPPGLAPASAELADLGAWFHLVAGNLDWAEAVAELHDRFARVLAGGDALLPVPADLVLSGRAAVGDEAPEDANTPVLVGRAGRDHTSA